MADFIRTRPADLKVGDIVVLSQLDDDFMVQDYDTRVEKIEQPLPNRYKITFTDEQQMFGSRTTLRVRE